MKLTNKHGLPEQEPVARLWECLGRWSAYLVANGEQANLAPPSWLSDAINAAVAPPQREWQGLTDEELLDIADMAYANDLELLQTLQAKLKEKNN